MSTEPGIQPTNPPARASIFTWIATILASAYIVWSGTALYLSTPKFIDMYSSLAVELPLATRTVLATYRFGYPLWFGGATVVVIAKQFYVREKWPNLSITLVAVVIADVTSRVIVWALYRPIFDMTEKLSK